MLPTQNPSTLATCCNLIGYQMLSALLLASPHLEVAARLGLDAEAGDWDPGRCKQKIQIDSDRYRMCGECPLESWNCINLVGSWIKIWHVQHCFFGKATQKDVFSWFYFVWFSLYNRDHSTGLPMEALYEFHLAVWIRADQTYQMSIAKFEELAEQKLLRRQQKAAIWIQARQGGRAAGPQGGRAALLGFVWLCALCACARWRSQRIRRPLRQVQLDLRHTVFPCLSVCLIVLNPFVRYGRFISFFDILSYPFISFHIL